MKVVSTGIMLGLMVRRMSIFKYFLLDPVDNQNSNISCTRFCTINSYRFPFSGFDLPHENHFHNISWTDMLELYIYIYHAPPQVFFKK